MKGGGETDHLGDRDLALSPPLRLGLRPSGDQLRRGNVGEAVGLAGGGELSRSFLTPTIESMEKPNCLRNGLL